MEGVFDKSLDQYNMRCMMCTLWTTAIYGSVGMSPYWIMYGFKTLRYYHIPPTQKEASAVQMNGHDSKVQSYLFRDDIGLTVFKSAAQVWGPAWLGVGGHALDDQSCRRRRVPARHGVERGLDLERHCAQSDLAKQTGISVNH